MNVRYRVELNQIERDGLTAMLGCGKHAARKLKRAQILLAADGGCRDEAIARAVRVSLSTVSRTKRRFGVKWNSRRRRMRRASAGAKASYNAPGLWIDKLSCTTRIQVALG